MIPSLRQSLKFVMSVIIALGLLTSPARSSAQSDWKQEWDKTLAAAKQEGQVTIYIYRYGRLLEDFEKEYPWLKVVSVSGRGSQLTGRIIAERRAGKYIADIFSGGANGNFNVLYKGKALDPIKPALILPEVMDKSKWYGGGSLSLINQAPHPNAAKVFINWFLSRKGQMALQKLGDPDDPPNSRRIDIPKENVPADNRLHEGRKYFDVVRPEYADMKPIFELAKEIMQANEQRR